MEIKLTKGKQERSIIELDKDYKIEGNVIIFYGPNGVGKTSLSWVMNNLLWTNSSNKSNVQIYNEHLFYRGAHIRDNDYSLRGNFKDVIIIYPYYQRLKEINRKIKELSSQTGIPVRMTSDDPLDTFDLQRTFAKIFKFNKLTRHNKKVLNENFLDVYSWEEINDYLNLYRNSLSTNIKELLTLCSYRTGYYDDYAQNFIKAIDNANEENQGGIADFKKSINEVENLEKSIQNLEDKYENLSWDERISLDKIIKRLKLKLNDLMNHSFYNKKYFFELIDNRDKTFEEINEFYLFLKSDEFSFKQKIFFGIMSSKPQLSPKKDENENYKIFLEQVWAILELKKEQDYLDDSGLKLVRSNFDNLEEIISNIFDIDKSEINIIRKEREIVVSFPREIATLSIGERHIFYIIFNLLFFFNFSESETLILDDPWSSFDELNKKLILNILNDFMKKYPNKRLIILTHDFFMFLISDNLFFKNGFNPVLKILDRTYDYDESIFKLSVKKMDLNSSLNIIENKKTFLEDCLKGIDKKVKNLKLPKNLTLKETFKNNNPNKEYLPLHYNLNLEQDVLKRIETFISDKNKFWVIERMDNETNFESLIVYKLIFLIIERLRIEKLLFDFINIKEKDEKTKEVNIKKLNGKTLKVKFDTFKEIYPEFKGLNGFLLSKFMDLNDSVHIVSDEVKNLDYSSYVFNASTYFIVNEAQKIEDILKIEEVENDFDKK